MAFIIIILLTSFFSVWLRPLPPSITPVIQTDWLAFSSITAQGIPPLPYVPGPGRSAWSLIQERY